jgi:gliding motility-associated-like protein
MLTGYIGFSQLSKKHFIPPLTSSAFGNANPEDQYIYISTPSNSQVPYTIIPVGQPTTNYITGNVSNATPQVESIGTGTGQLFVSSNSTSVVTSNKGYIIESEAPIYVSIRMNAGNGAQAGALVSKGLSALDTIFRIGTFTSSNPQSNYLSFVSVMATEDDTQVTFDNLPPGLIIKNYSGSTRVTVNLNEGESYIIAINTLDNGPTVNNLMDGLIGCLVTSSKPIVTNCGSANGSFGNGNARDYGIDQIAGLSKIGNEYIFVRGNGTNDWENVLIVPHTYPTNVFINGNATPITITASDRYRVLEGNNYNNNGNMYIRTSQDVFAYQGVGASSEANQGMFFVPPLSCETRGNIDNIPIIDFIGNTDYSEDSGVSIVTKAGATVTINNTALNALPGINVIGPTPVTGKTDYVTYKATGLRGNVSVQGDDELYVAYFNVNGAATSGSFYSGFPSNPEINFDAEFVTLGNCIPNVTLEAANAQNFDSFKWLFDDGLGGGYIDLMVITPEFTPTIPGKYKLIGIITCTGEELESAEIPVSICPDDRDIDGIIDNIDIDNDNDGVLNCTESKGDVIMDLSETRNPVLRFQDGTINSTIANQIINAPNTNTIKLTGTGNIISTIPANSNDENNYGITFTETVNINLSEDTLYSHNSIDDEYFIIKISPVNKNITLVDPDDRLLVDSNFDGLFETNVTQISGSEIHFKYNPNPKGSTPYNFFANQVATFELIHRQQNMTNTSNFQINLALTCFKNDNDSDGIEDALDLDSDNDGIPDILEGDGKSLTLSGIDINNDGLDDQFEPVVNPLDSDNDGIYDFYDLDSDNDGIYDLVESGSGLIDINLNGIIDNVNSTIGVNGWDDNAESSPDSNLIGYTISDTDADTFFNYYDPDSDGDTCSDVIEAGFSDANNDDFLGDLSPTVDKNGKVNNTSDGYTSPNSDYLNIAPLSFNTQPVNTAICLFANGSITVDSNEAEVFQWEVSIDGVNWANIADNTTYNGSQTSTLNFTNVPLSLDTSLYRVKIDRIGNSCGLYSDTAKLTIYPLPVVNTPSVYTQCDDDSNDGQAFFNLTLNTIKEEINPNYNTDNLVFTYYETPNEAELDTNRIMTPEAYQNNLGFAIETIWIRVENPNGCFSVVSLDLQVSPSSADLNTYTPNSFYLCDDGIDLRDGVSTFNFTSVKTYITDVIFNGFNISVHFFESQIDAELETNEIPDISNHQNINAPNNQDIWVRVKSDLGNDCLGLKVFPSLLVVESLPIANTVTIERQCDYVLNDGILSALFDTSQIENDLLNDQNPTDVTVTYVDERGKALPSPLPNPFLTENQNITIRLTNNISLAPNGPCYDETTLTFIVDEQPFANPIADQIVCDGSAGDIDDDGLYTFNTSTFSNTILGSQSNMEIYYDYTDENGDLQLKATSLPNPLVAPSQIINVEVVNPNNSVCNAITSINLVVNPLPEFTVETPRIVCTSDPTFSIVLEPFELNASETFDYEWLWSSLDGTVNNQFISNDKKITVSIPGTYSIRLIKTDGTGCFRKRDIFVDASELANITLDDVTIKDLSENNSVTIDRTNLGRGNYQYALKEENSSFINYQDGLIFNNVYPGFYTIYVKDDICGVATLDISVIGHAKVFTPNGDGINDNWQIKGIGASVQPNSIVHIYDRYGKLLKQLSVESNGWDGTFNGSQLPSNDYWFKLQLEDGRVYSGHFTLKR